MIHIDQQCSLILVLTIYLCTCSNSFCSVASIANSNAHVHVHSSIERKGVATSLVYHETKHHLTSENPFVTDGILRPFSFEYDVQIKKNCKRLDLMKQIKQIQCRY
jgi:hypothetical protein